MQLMNHSYVLIWISNCMAIRETGKLLVMIGIMELYYYGIRDMFLAGTYSACTTAKSRIIYTT